MDFKTLILNILRLFKKFIPIIVGIIIIISLSVLRHYNTKKEKEQPASKPVIRKDNKPLLRSQRKVNNQLIESTIFDQRKHRFNRDLIFNSFQNDKRILSIKMIYNDIQYKDLFLTEEELLHINKFIEYLIYFEFPVNERKNKLLYLGSSGKLIKCVTLRQSSILLEITHKNQVYIIKKVFKSQRTIQEIKISKTLKHDNILKVFQIIETKESWLNEEKSFLWILEEKLNMGWYEFPKYKFEDIKTIALDLLKAVEFCNKLKVIHRDIKVDNFGYKWEDGKRKWKLFDFGYSVFNKNHDAHRVGWAAQLAPEWYVNHLYTHKTDIWAIGMTLLHIIIRHPDELNILGYKIRSNPQSDKALLLYLNDCYKYRPNKALELVKVQ